MNNLKMTYQIKKGGSVTIDTKDVKTAEKYEPEEMKKPDAEVKYNVSKS